MPAWLDRFEGPEANPEFNGIVAAAQALGDESSDAWLERYAQNLETSSRDCKGLVEDWRADTIGGIAIRRIDLECQGIRVTDVVFVVDRVGYVMSGNRPTIIQFLETFEAGSLRVP